MKNTLMLIAITITLIIAVTVNGKISFGQNEYRESIKRETLKQLKLWEETDCDLFLMDTTTKDGYHYDTFVFIFKEGGEQRGYELTVMRNNEFAILKISIIKEVNVREGRLSELWGTK